MIQSQQSQSNEPQPWYVKKKKYQNESHQDPPSNKNKVENFFDKIIVIRNMFFLILPSLFAFVFSLLCGITVTLIVRQKTHGSVFVFFIFLSFVFFCIAVLFLLYQIGSICAHFTSIHQDTSYIALGFKFLQGKVEREENRRGIPAPEMALYQFVQQVRGYAMEKSFLKHKQDRTHDSFSHLVGGDPSAILKRRWNDVFDSLNEFEIYLANDPRGIIEKLIAKSPSQNMDVSQIFRDVAETFDTTWRRKGINIEQAIVTPLKANTNEALLRRLLVGPWRSCVYFARRGNGVIFSAKSVNGKIIAHWECDGVVFPDSFFQIVHNLQLSVNERIEKGIEMVALDPNSPNTLFALISFVTWLDLAKAASCDYSIDQGNNGFVIELRI